VIAHIVFRVAVVVRAQIAGTAEKSIDKFATKLKTGTWDAIAHFGVDHGDTVVSQRFAVIGMSAARGNIGSIKDTCASS